MIIHRWNIDHRLPAILLCELQTLPHLSPASHVTRLASPAVRQPPGRAAGGRGGRARRVGGGGERPGGRGGGRLPVHRGPDLLDRRQRGGHQADLLEPVVSQL